MYLKYLLLVTSGQIIYRNVLEGLVVEEADRYKQYCPKDVLETPQTLQNIIV